MNFLSSPIIRADPKKASEIANMIQDPVLANLAEAVSNSNLVLQVTSEIFSHVISEGSITWIIKSSRYS